MALKLVKMVGVAGFELEYNPIQINDLEGCFSTCRILVAYLPPV